MLKRFALAAAMWSSVSPAAFAEMQSPQAARHILNLDDVEITALIEDVSMVTGYTFIIHPDVKSKRVTVMSSTPMSSEEVFDVFLSTLRVHGFTAVPAGRGTYRVIPEQAAISEVGLGVSSSNALVTEVIKLDYFNAVEAAQMVKPLIDAQGQVVANRNSNTLIIVDYASNLAKLRSIVSGLDRDMTQVETIALKNVPAKEMAQILNDLTEQRSEDAFRINLTAVPSDTSNAIVIRGDEMSVGRALKVALELDQTDPVRDNLRVVRLSNADAEDIVPILQRVGDTMATQSSPGQGPAAAPTVDYHAPSNSLVISANYETLLAMERVIAALDTRRSQVLVEAIIVEMADDTARELGVQFLLAGTGNSSTPFASTNFSRSAPNLLALAGAIGEGSLFGDADDETVNNSVFLDAAVSSLLGANGLVLGGGGQEGDTLFGAILTAVQTDQESRILSTPFGMALDNSTTSLLVGQDIPITTGEVLGDANTNPFRTVQREKVGVKLDVTPKISNDDSVRLNIYQEVSSVSNLIGPSSDFVIDTRSISTEVLADDGEIIVLGGLIEQVDTSANSRVPILGDVPGIGRLFRSEGKSRSRTNLVVFIKPTIVRDTASAGEVTAKKYRYLRAEEILRGETGPSELDQFIEQVVGSRPPQ